jgi:hypothetical protein
MLAIGFIKISGIEVGTRVGVGLVVGEFVGVGDTKGVLINGLARTLCLIKSHGTIIIKEQIISNPIIPVM